MRYVVGYQPDERGADAVALAVAIARTQGTGLDIVYVVADSAPYAALNPKGSAQRQRAGSRHGTPRGLELIPSDVKAEFKVVRPTSSPRD